MRFVSASKKKIEKKRKRKRKFSFVPFHLSNRCRSTKVFNFPMFIRVFLVSIRIHPFVYHPLFRDNNVSVLSKLRTDLRKTFLASTGTFVADPSVTFLSQRPNGHLLIVFYDSRLTKPALNVPEEKK